MSDEMMPERVLLTLRLVPHTFRAEETFEQAAEAIMDKIRRVQAEFPDEPRVLQIRVEGHQNDFYVWDADATELMTVFSPYVLRFVSLLTHPALEQEGKYLYNPCQHNDVPGIFIAAFPEQIGLTRQIAEMEGEEVEVIDPLEHSPVTKEWER